LAGIVMSQVARVTMSYVVHPFRPSFQISGWRELAGFSFWTWAAAAASVVWDRADPFVLGPVIGSAQLGLYLLALELAILPITEIVSPVADALFAGFALAQKRGTSSIHHAPIVAATLMMCIMPITITLSCGSGYVVAALLGPKWIAANILVNVLAWLCLFSPISFVCSVVLTANGFVKRNFLGKVIVSAIKLLVMLITVSMTSRLDLIAVSVTVCVAVESCAYSLLLRGLSNGKSDPIAGAITRTVIAGSVVVIALYWAGLAWRPVSMPSLQAFLYSAGLGLVVLIFYVFFILGLWQLAGRPAGPETQLLSLAKMYMRLVVQRLWGMAA
jgi:lipopolysaccharide exporter